MKQVKDTGEEYYAYLVVKHGKSISLRKCGISQDEINSLNELIAGK